MDEVQNFVDDELKLIPSCTEKFSGLSVLRSFAGQLESADTTVDVLLTYDTASKFKLINKFLFGSSQYTSVDWRPPTSLSIFQLNKFSFVMKLPTVMVCQY